MDEQEPPETPQLYLVTPTAFEAEVFAPVLARLLDSVDVACLRLALASEDEAALSRAADQCREVAHARDVPLVIDRHIQLVERLGLDGVHLLDGARSVRDTRKTLGADAIIGAACGTSRHDGMNAGEAGADYVTFGPVGESDLGDGSRAEHDLFAWWSQMIEVPVVAEGALTEDLVGSLASVTDFFAIGPEIWRHDDPIAALQALTAPLR
ncbi:thiamine phosphate synthase [Gymnodinialimonas ceratoperidinii]|uniref:Thiamine phosphate synthase n=1 Tax=Gymnodinialimonas ceratoperidinii TaxID=2856823 RepID=A0A8F6Y9D4_9RHOB|nr:thiamine phosphate synthase [Gymnodinialimonas ceratoperidinii]QXT38453.1 thiamine phosphate synthase [Gymnodinialimonas ceratoperidinii]